MPLLAGPTTQYQVRGNADIFVDDSFGSAGAVGDGVTDDSAAITAKAAALVALGGGRLHFGAKTYAFDAWLFGSNLLVDVTLIGVRGRTVWKNISPTGTANPFTLPGILQFTRCKWDGFIFDGNNRAIWTISNAKGIEFVNCQFQRMTAALILSASSDIDVSHCLFNGVDSTVMAAGMLDPTPVSTATYRRGLTIQTSSSARVHDNEFHFCESGFVATSGADQEVSVDGLWLERNSFRGDWFNNPYRIFTIVPTAFTTTYPSIITVAGGGLTGKFTDDFTIAVPILIGSGAAFTRIYTGEVTFSTATTEAMKIGDVIEVAGKRAEITRVQAGTTHVYVRRWEDMATFLETDPPALATAWRVRRYYSASTYRPNGYTDTTIGVYTEPINPHDGERLVTDAGRTMVGVTCIVFPRLIYSGSHMSYARKVRIIDNDYRGSWADQCSNFNTDDLMIDGNVIDLGQDEGITITDTTRTSVSRNHLLRCGTSGVFCGSLHAQIADNWFHNWGQTNRNVVSAIDLRPPTTGGTSACLVSGNTCTRDAGALGGAANYLVGFYGNGVDSFAGTRITGNTSPGARLGQVLIDNDIKASVTVRDGTTLGAFASYAVTG